MSSAKPVVYYDGSCPLCQREIGFYKSKDGADAIEWTDVSACPARAVAPDLAQDAAMARFHVRDADGRLLSGAAAFAALWSAMPGFRWAGRIASWPGVRNVLEIAYRGSLVVRPWLQGLVARWDARRG